MTALFLLNAALTFENVWPTPAVRWAGGLSVELGVSMVALAALAWRFGPLPSRMSSALAAGGVVLVFGRYATVTSPALFGRDVNLYWDLRFIPDVIAMLARPASWLVTLAVLVALVAVPLLLFRVLRWGFRTLTGALQDPRGQRAIGISGLMIIALFALQRSLEPGNEWAGYHDRRLVGTIDFPEPVTATYARQVRILARQLSGDAARRIGPGPDLDASLAGIKDVDVLLFFVESYGAIAYDRPEFRSELEPARQALAEQVAASGLGAVSAFVESPTFGGGSWLAHISLLTGLEVRDEDTNQVLLTQRRDSLVTTFSKRGYRTVAMMPGLQRDWPEGGFYRFDQIYGERHIEYKGPQFGWWVVPDQFSLARLDELEFAPPDRSPTFAFMAGVTTHTPFSPAAPYQPDWDKLMSIQPFSPASIDEAYENQPDWLDLGPSFLRAMNYVYSSIAGFVERTAGRDIVLIVLGDHQPPALVSGMGAPWDVPVHVITNRPSVLAALERRGFVRGVEPPRTVVAKMHELAPVLLEAFSAEPAPAVD